MKFVILCALFAPIIYLALRQKKWYLYLLFAFIAVLPEQFSVRLHESIPLLTVSRILILITIGFWLYDKWKTRKLQLPKSLILFFAISLIVSLVNLRYGTQEIKRIFLLIFERVLLVIVMIDMIHDREEFHRCIDFTIMGCTALAVIGIVQTVFNYDISSVLHLTKTFTSIQLAKRMGLVRAFGTYNAISYGCYCAFMALLILYRLYKTKSIWHNTAFALNFIALICTFTRSAWLCLAGIAVLVFLMQPVKMIKDLWPSLVLIVVLCLGLGMIQPKFGSALIETAKSSWNTVIQALPDEWFGIIDPAPADPTATTPTATGPDSTTPTDPETPSQKPQRPTFELSEDFGANANNPTYSRTAQWTAIEYMTQEGELLFGYGYNALPRGKIHFFFDIWAAEWQPTGFLDVGFVALLTETGLIGTLAYLSLLAYIFMYAFIKKQSLKKQTLDFFWVVVFMIPLYLLLNYLASFPHAQIVWIFIGLFFVHQKLDDQKKTEEHPRNSKHWLFLPRHCK